MIIAMIPYFSSFKKTFDYKSEATRLEFNTFLIVAYVITFIGVMSLTPLLMLLFPFIHLLPFFSLAKRRINNAFKGNKDIVWKIFFALLLTTFILPFISFLPIFLFIFRFVSLLIFIFILMLMIKK